MNLTLTCQNDYVFDFSSQKGIKNDYPINIG